MLQDWKFTHIFLMHELNDFPAQNELIYNKLVTKVLEINCVNINLGHMETVFLNT